MDGLISLCTKTLESLKNLVAFFGFFGEALGVLLVSISILVVRLIFGFGGGSRGEPPRTSSTNRPRISKERRNDEF